MPPQPGIGGRAGTKEQIAKRFPSQVAAGFLVPGESFIDQRKRNKNNPAYVRLIQTKLREAGFNVAVDGVWGPQTSKAYHAYTYVRNAPGGSFSTLLNKGPEAAFKELQKRYAREIQAAQKKYQGMLKALQAEPAGVKGLAIAQFWAGIGESYAGGAFADRSRKSKKIVSDYEKAVEKYQSEQEKQLDRNKPAGGIAGFVGKVASKLNFGGIPGKVLGRAIDLVEEPYMTLARGAYTSQFLQNQRIAKGQGLLSNDTRQFTDFLQGVVAGLPGGSNFISPAAREAYDAVNDYEERDALTKAGQLESLGRRTERTMWATIMQRWGSPATKAALANATTFQAATPGFKPSWASGVLDFGFNLVDPVGLTKPVRVAGAISDGYAATKFIARNPGLAHSLTMRVAQAATKAATRDVGELAGVGDVRFLQQLVPSLKRTGATTELAAALAATRPQAALAYLGKLADAADPSSRVGTKFRALVDEAISKVKDQGMTLESRQAILTASLGRTWKPTVGLQTRMVASALDKTMAGRGLSAMPYLTRQAKLTSMMDLASRAGKGQKVTNLGLVAKDPETGNLLRHAKRSAAEKAEAKAYLAALNAKDFRADVHIIGLANRIQELPEGPFKRIMEERFTALEDTVASVAAGGDIPPAFKSLDKGLRKEITQLEREVVGFQKLKPITYERAVYNFESEMRDYAYMVGKAPAARVSPWTRVRRAVSRTFDTVPKAVVNLHDVNERARAFHDYALALGMSQGDANQAFARMATTMEAEDALKQAERLSDGLVRSYLKQEGLDKDQVAEVWAHIKQNANEFWRDQEGWFSLVDTRSGKFKSKFDKVYDAKGAKNAQVLSQRQYNWHMVDPLDLRRYVLEYKRTQGSRMAGIAAGAHVATMGLYQAYLPIHHAFKFLALTLAAPRYILRVAAMEERLRMWMTHGFTSAGEISSRHARRMNNLMLEESHGKRWFTGWEHVGIENMPMHLMSKKMIQVTGHGLIDKGNRGFVENLWHVLMFQVRPEDDFLHHLLMPHLWDEEALKAARESAIEALETTHNGRVYLEKAIMVNSELRDSKKLVAQTEKWLKQVMPNQAVVDKRLDGQFTIRELASHEEWQPEKIWGDKYESLWKPRNPVNMFRDVMGRLTIQAPTTHLNRLPFAFAEFNKEFDALTASGFRAEVAKEMAGDWAQRRTNDILFDASVRTRFAQKFDVFFPFQQAREEVVRVWGRLLKESPERGAKLLRLAATLFNAGKSEGMIVQNQFGDWEMRVPGSPALAKALGRYAPEWVPFKRQFTQLAGTGYNANLRNLLFVNDVWGTTPRPGGPWWVATGNLAVQTHPEWFPRSGFLQKYLFNEMNPTTMFLRPEVTRLWIAATGKTFVPWEPLASFGWGGRESYTEGVRDRMVGEVGAELYRQWILAGADPKEKPTPEDIANAVRAQLFMWGLASMVVPSSTRVVVEGREDFEDVKEQFTKNGELDFAAMANAHPEMIGFWLSHSKDAVRERYTDENGNVDLERLKRENPEYWARWKAAGSPYEDGPEGLVDAIYRARDYLDPEEFSEKVNDSLRMSEAWDEFHLILNSGDPYWKTTQAIAEWEREYGDLDEAHGAQLRDYRRDREFDKIMRLPDFARETALKEWQFKYNVSLKETTDLQIEWSKGITSHYNPWMEARNTLDLVGEWQREGKGESAVTFGKKHLTPAERIKFYRYLMGYADDIQDFNELWAAHGETNAKHGKELYENTYAKKMGEVQKLAEDYYTEKRLAAAGAIDDKYDKIAELTALQQSIIKQANATKDYKARGRLWAQYYALKDRKNKLFAEIRGIQNSMYRRHADLDTVAEELKYLELATRAHQQGRSIVGARLDKLGIPYFLDSQERKFAQMPERIQKDYVTDLVERLTVPAGRYVTERGESSLKWEYLTEFQKDILATKLDKRKLDMVKRMSVIREGAEGGGGGGFRRRRGGRWQIDGLGLGEGFGELAFAFEQFKRYNRRGNMAEPKAELKEYLRLGDNAVLKAAYLRSHPRLQEWLRKGPMANMPIVLAEVVRNIMVKYGRWDSDEGVLSWDDIAEIGFARTMLARYTKRGRGEQAPHAYELWLKMPTGKKRLDYMKAHPEIERWLQRGPMANMPPEYQDVVRDIMTKFGLWTKRTDPLSVLLEEYFQVPDIAKQKFLEDHPEILAYWRAIRTGRERALFDLAQNYFAIQDPEGKRAYLLAHPELQQYFIEERQRRYQSFLNNVARYLGRTPELADQYLAAQTVYIKQMVDMFGQRPLVPDSVIAVYSRGARGEQGNVTRQRSI